MAFMEVKSFYMHLYLHCLLVPSLTAYSASFSATFHSHYYWFSLTHKHQSAAESFCRDLGGHLVWVETEAEQQWLAAQVATVDESKVKYWYIGLYEIIGQDGMSNYTWTTGQSAMYTNMGPNEPSHQHEKCVTMEKQMDFHWADVNCDRSEAFICKLGIVSMGKQMPAYRGNKYYISEAKLTFAEAQTFCEGISANLAWIQNHQELEALAFFTRNKEPSLWYIGLYNASGTGSQFWTSGQPVSATYFSDNGNGIGDCYAMAKFKQGVWLSVECSRLEAFICKLDIKPPTSFTYWLSREAKTMEGAEESCVGLGGHLAWVTSMQENNWLGGQISMDTSGVSSWLLGYTGYAQEETCWNGNYGCGFENFIDAERNISDQYCVTIERTKGYQWDVVECNSTEHFICKVPLNSSPYLYGNSQYFFSSTPLNYTDAQTFCQRTGGSLAWILDEEEMKWIQYVLNADYPGHPYWYIGLYDFVGRSQWDHYHWLSGHDSNYRNFDVGEPQFSHERCVTTEKPKHYKWADVPCDRPEPFVCKRLAKPFFVENVPRYT